RMNGKVEKRVYGAKHADSDPLSQELAADPPESPHLTLTAPTPPILNHSGVSPSFAHEQLRTYRIHDAFGEVTSSSEAHQGPQLEVSASGRNFPALMDTGSDIDAICNVEVYHMFVAKGCPTSASEYQTAVLADQTIVEMKKQVQVEISVANGRSKTTVWIACLPGIREPLVLGYPVLKSLRIVWDLYHHRYIVIHDKRLALSVSVRLSRGIIREESVDKGFIR